MQTSSDGCETVLSLLICLPLSRIVAHSLPPAHPRCSGSLRVRSAVLCWQKPSLSLVSATICRMWQGCPPPSGPGFCSSSLIPSVATRGVVALFRACLSEVEGNREMLRGLYSARGRRKGDAEQPLPVTGAEGFIALKPPALPVRPQAAHHSYAICQRVVLWLSCGGCPFMTPIARTLT